MSDLLSGPATQIQAGACHGITVIAGLGVPLAVTAAPLKQGAGGEVPPQR